MSVIKAIEFPEKEFSSKEELFKELSAKKTDIISLKKAEIKSSDSIRSGNSTVKNGAIKGLDLAEGFIYPVINTTKYLDSHNDVHLNGIWNKSVKDQQGKTFYVADHSLSVMSVIAFPKDVEMIIMEIPWKDLNTSFDGNTQALVFKVKKENIRLKEAKDIVEEKIDIEHSVRMRYVKIDLAINSNDDDFADEKAVWDNAVGIIANKEVAIEQGYFWAVGEAEIFKEGSMVLAGSNDVTPMMQKDIEPLDNTHEPEPSKDTRKALL